MPKVLKNVKDRIIEESRKLLLEGNFKDLSIREIAKHCNIGLGTFYNYFSSKEELIPEIFTEDWLQVIGVLDGLEDSDDVMRDKLERIYRAIEVFTDRYEKTSYEINSMSGCKDFISELAVYVAVEIDNGNIESGVSAGSLAHFIAFNFMDLARNKHMEYEEFFDGILKKVISSCGRSKFVYL